MQTGQRACPLSHLLKSSTQCDKNTFFLSRKSGRKYDRKFRRQPKEKRSKSHPFVVTVLPYLRNPTQFFLYTFLHSGIHDKIHFTFSCYYLTLHHSYFPCFHVVIFTHIIYSFRKRISLLASSGRIIYTPRDETIVCEFFFLFCKPVSLLLQ